VSNPHDQGREPAASLAPNQPVFTGRLVVLAGADRGRLIIPVSFYPHTEAFLVSITNPPTQAGALPAAAQFLIQSAWGDVATFRRLADCEFLPPCANHLRPLPAWLDNITIDARGVAPAALGAARDISLAVVVYRVDRVVRQDWKGPR
jgi:hypothetical protein